MMRKDGLIAALNVAETTIQDSVTWEGVQQRWAVHTTLATLCAGMAELLNDKPAPKPAPVTREESDDCVALIRILIDAMPTNEEINSWGQDELEQWAMDTATEIQNAGFKR